MRAHAALILEQVFDTGVREVFADRMENTRLPDAIAGDGKNIVLNMVRRIVGGGLQVA